MIKKILIPLSLLLAWTSLPATPAGTQGSSQDPQVNQISTGRFKLLIRSRGFILKFVSKGKTKWVAIPRDWLIPPEDEKHEESSYVTSFRYDKAVSAFPIGNGRIGLHLSSYDIQKGGSAQAAAGRDVFLIFDPGSSTISRGGIERGVTKNRVRWLGCFAASGERYLLGDVNGDGLTDIGVVKEEVQCLEKPDADVDTIMGPFYKEYPVAWYVFKGNAWNLDENFSGKFPEHYLEMPLIGIDRSPVDVVGSSLWQTGDRTHWPTADNH